MDFVNYYRVSELKENGWTDGLIKKYLPSPDKLVKNPVFKSKSPMRMYLLATVKQAIEKNNLAEVLESNLQKRSKRSESALAAEATKKKKMMEWVNNIKIDVPVFDYPDLIELACEHYNQRLIDKNPNFITKPLEYLERSAIPDYSDPCFLERITRNFLRHKMSDYEALLRQCFGKVGTTEAYHSIKGKVENEISRSYPELRQYLQESYRQYMEKYPQIMCNKIC